MPQTEARPKLFAFAAALLLMAGCAQPGTGTTPRIPGPYDPGQNAIPSSEQVTTLCGKKVARALYTLSDRYIDVATEWERYQVYAEETETDGTTAEELDGLDKRHRNITTALRRYRSAAPHRPRSSTSTAGRQRSASSPASRAPSAAHATDSVSPRTVNCAIASSPVTRPTCVLSCATRP